MAERTAVALYARISRDPSGDMLGVTRQLEDCRAEAERRGWKVAEEYVDDDTSAYSGNTRPAYERMLRDITDGLVDAVIVYRMDRLHRRPLELEHFADTCKAAGLTDVVSLQGEFDMGKSDGLFVARLMASVAAHESHVKSERIKRKFLQTAETGAPYMGGGHRPFGYQDDRATPHEVEATVFREAAARVLAGETLYSVAAWIEATGMTGTKGSKMTPSALRALLLSPRNYGMRVHQGQIIGVGTWTPLISAEDGERLRLLLTDPKRRTNRAARRYLLSGLLRCGKCGATMKSHPRNGVRRYGCGIQSTQHDPCKGTYIVAEPVEALIAEAVLVRLDSPDLVGALTSTVDEDKVHAVGDEIAADQGRMDVLADTFADGHISREEWKRARDRIEARMEANRKALDRMTRRDAIEDYIGQGESLRDQWEGLNLSKQVPIIKAVIESVSIMPSRASGMQRFDPSRVQPVWRL